MLPLKVHPVSTDYRRNLIIEKIKNQPDLPEFTNDTFPFKRYYMTEKEILDRFERLKNYKFDIKTGNYIISNLPRNCKDLLKFNGQLTYIFCGQESNEYDKYNNISDYFNEEARLRAKRKYSAQSSWEYWHTHKTQLQQVAKETYGRITAYSLRETLFDSFFECGTFKPTLAVGLIKFVEEKLNKKNLKMLDISSGWGDRLIGAAAADCSLYEGADPNSLVHDGYNKMIEFFNLEKNKFILHNSGFENAQLTTNDFDLCLSSPPYFDLEIYTDTNDKNQSIYKRDVNSWLNDWLIPCIIKAINALRSGGYLIININNISPTTDYTISMVKAVNKFSNVRYLGQIAQWTEIKGRSAQPFWFWIKL